MVSKRVVLTKEDPAVKYLISADSRLASVIKILSRLEYTTYDDSFSFLINTIIGQMISNQAADVLSQRLLNLCGGKIRPKIIKKLGIPGIKPIGISHKKAEYIVFLTEKYLDNISFFTQLAELSDEQVIFELTSLRGIGIWTAKMYLIFVLDRLDVLPFEDGAFLRVYKWLYEPEDVTPWAITKYCEMWRPYSSIAARFLYRFLDEGYTKTGIL